MQIALITFFFCAATTGAIMGGCLLGKKQQDAAAQQIYQKLEEAVIVPGKDNAENLQMDHLPELDEEMLKDQNHEYAAWIYIPDTVISYPVVFPEDNKTYLTQGFEKNRHSYGCLFFDASAKPFSMVNTVIHGHNMRSGDMFGSLKNYLKQDYADQHTELYLLIDGKYRGVADTFHLSWKERKNDCAVVKTGMRRNITDGSTKSVCRQRKRICQRSWPETF